MSIHGKGVGVYSKMSGSGCPSFVIADPGDPEIPFDHPFKVTVFMDGLQVKYRVRAGTVNNLVVKMDTTYLDAIPAPSAELDGNGTWRIYIKASSSAPPVFFPNTVVVEAHNTEQTDTDSNGYLLLATVVVASGKPGPVNQYVYASQVLVRAKPGEATALWSWSSR